MDRYPGRLFLDPPLDLGATVGHRFFRRRHDPADLAGSFARCFSVKGGAPARVAAFFGPPLQHALLELPGQLHVDDRLVVVSRGSWLRARATPFGADVPGRLIALAELLDQARAAAPTDPALRGLEPGWEKVAGTLGLTTWRVPLGMGGRRAGADVRAAIRGVGHRMRFTVWIELHRSLDLGMSITPQVGLAGLGAALGGRRADRVVGEERFDEAFVVRASAPGVLPHVVDDRVRRALLVCARHASELSLHDRGAQLAGEVDPADAPAVPDVVRSALEAVERIAERQRLAPPVEAGPFR